MSKTCAVIELGTSKVICLIADKNELDEANVLGMGYAEYAPVHSGGLPGPDDLLPAVVKAVKDADAQSGRRIRNIYLCVPASECRVTTGMTHMDLGTQRLVTNRDVEMLFNSGRQAVARKGYQILQHCPITFWVDDMLKMEPVGEQATRLDAHVSYILGSENYIQNATALLNQIGINVLGVIAAPLGQALTFIQPQERDHTALLLDVGYATMTLSVVKGDGLLYLHTFPVGGRNISRDIATVEGINYGFAEQLKRRCVFGLNISPDDCYEAMDRSAMKLVKFPAERIQQVVESRLDEMLDTVFDRLSASGVELPEQVTLHLTGGGICFMRGIKDYVQRKYGLETQIAQPRGSNLNKPSHSAICGVLDMIIKQELDGDEDEGLFNRIKNLFKF